jgi:hypothetical protein
MCENYLRWNWKLALVFSSHFQVSQEVTERVVCLQYFYALVTDAPWVPLRSFSKHGEGLRQALDGQKKAFQDILMTTDP